MGQGSRYLSSQANEWPLVNADQRFNEFAFCRQHVPGLKMDSERPVSRGTNRPRHIALQVLRLARKAILKARDHEFSR